MLKYKEVKVTFTEVPDEISLCINITNCPHRCDGCHSPHLQEDIGEPLTTEVLQELIDANRGITCVCFMGGDNDTMEICRLAKWIRDNTELKTAWYTAIKLSEIAFVDTFDYIKTGPYVRELGGLDSPDTNQRFYKVRRKPYYQGSNDFYDILDDITYKFRKNGDSQS